ncbi:hypothetical protein [Enterovibrio nigricans]|uniref:Uncharacterized protein n=1 Tax=Enterovibrio nigricans DSM 22720 TaxID=1121868 RepID=A0A1T4W5M7_9GAMM|nr:hypothetical protein [Enterovibrio nigricans]PKF48878.1 hypothetical protein AT251_22940 [Enterovibrio nigricans]SKA72572.1 hypothetical protein SAMN02745132_04766 [Enterovibrio nigricans DSM 22720]
MTVKYTLSLLSLSILSTSAFASSPCEKFQGDAINFLVNNESIAHVPVDRKSFVEAGYIIGSELTKKFNRICLPENLVIYTFSKSKLSNPSSSFSIPKGTVSEFSQESAKNIKALSFHNDVEGVLRWENSKIIEQGQLARYLNPFTDNVELFSSKTNGYMEYFPINGESDNNWQLISQEKTVEPHVVLNMGEKQTEAERRAKEARVPDAEITEEIIDSTAYKKFVLVNGREGSGSNYGFTVKVELEKLSGKELISENFYEYHITSEWGNYHLDPRPINYMSYPQSDKNTKYKFTVRSNARASIGDVIQIVGQLKYSDGSVYQIRTNKITLAR